MCYTKSGLAGGQVGGKDGMWEAAITQVMAGWTEVVGCGWRTEAENLD